MNGQTLPSNLTLATKIARLVEERGWNQREFARRTGLSYQTAREILARTGEYRPHNATIPIAAWTARLRRWLRNNHSASGTTTRIA